MQPTTSTMRLDSRLAVAGAVTFAVFLGGAANALAATYSYVNTAGEIQVIEAATAEIAIENAVNRDPNSGVVAGVLGAGTVTIDEGMMMTPATDTPAADLRVGLNALLKEHVNLGLSALFNVIDNSPATTGSVEALDGNSVDLATTIGSVYGNDAEAAFLQIWRDHIDFFANYATGLRTDDADLRMEAEADLEDYQTEIAVFFTSALPNIDGSMITAGAREHKALLLEALDEYDEGNYEAAYEAQREADVQISGLANLLSAEIVAQNPNLF